MREARLGKRQMDEEQQAFFFFGGWEDEESWLDLVVGLECATTESDQQFNPCSRASRLEDSIKTKPPFANQRKNTN
jgi:hypothetical protein